MREPIDVSEDVPVIGVAILIACAELFTVAFIWAWVTL